MNAQMPLLVPALPEIFLALAAMLLLMFGVFAPKGKDRSPAAIWLAIGSLMLAWGLVVVIGQAGEAATFGGMFILDTFAVFAKTLVLAASVLALLMARVWLRIEGLNRFEFPVLVLFATIGMLMMISANGLIALYVGLELQSLSLYIIAAYNRDNVRSTEAGLKYFVLGALASGLLLYGASLIYGFTGHVNFTDIAKALTAQMHEGHGMPIGVIVGVAFVLAGLAFKVAAVPFHMWTPDVYEGAPTPVTAFFAAGPKIAAVALLLRVMFVAFAGLAAQWQQIVVFIALASMVLGAFAGINQSNIKRLMAYSSIGHIGYALVGVAVANVDGVQAVLIYMAIYLPMTIGAFICIQSMRQKGRALEGINDLAGLSRTNPLMAAALAISMFSMAGIPPMAGFFGKFYIFMAAIDAGMYILAVLGVLTSAVGAFYYLRIIKVMYFDEPADAFDRPLGRSLTAVLALATAFVLLFFISPNLLLSRALVAAQSLFG